MAPRAHALLALSAAVAFAACSESPSGGSGVAAVALQPLSAALCLGDSLTYTAQVVDVLGHAIPSYPVRWSSSAPLVVAVDSVSGVAHALTFGTAQISAEAGGIHSGAPGRLDVPADLSPEFTPDTVVLAPGDTFTLGARLRRQSAGPVPTRTPVITPLDTAPASLAATGLVTGKATGTASFSLSACGVTGHGAAQVYTPPDSTSGVGYLWLSGPAEIRARLTTAVHNFTLSSKKPAFQIFGSAGSNARQFAYEDTVQLTNTGSYALDSLLTSEATNATCSPPRPFAVYQDNASLTALVSLHGGSAAVTRYTSAGYRTVSGRVITRMRGVVGGVVTALDTLQAIYTFSAPLRDTTGVCP
jgi:hypothetical protein